MGADEYTAQYQKTILAMRRQRAPLSRLHRGAWAPAPLGNEDIRTLVFLAIHEQLGL
jgi:hypothetical protein